jgi:hypothetical protein
MEGKKSGGSDGGDGNIGASMVKKHTERFVEIVRENGRHHGPGLQYLMPTSSVRYTGKPVALSIASYESTIESSRH